MRVKNKSLVALAKGMLATPQSYNDIVKPQEIDIYTAKRVKGELDTHATKMQDSFNGLSNTLQQTLIDIDTIYNHIDDLSGKDESLVESLGETKNEFKHDVYQIKSQVQEYAALATKSIELLKEQIADTNELRDIQEKEASEKLQKAHTKEIQDALTAVRERETELHTTIKQQKAQLEEKILSLKEKLEDVAGNKKDTQLEIEQLTQLFNNTLETISRTEIIQREHSTALNDLELKVHTLLNTEIELRAGKNIHIEKEQEENGLKTVYTITATTPSKYSQRGGSYLQISENLADLDNAATARTNLGLGTMATENTIDYYTADEVDDLLADSTEQKRYAFMLFN